METVQIQVSSDLARRLRSYRDDLPLVLERVLRQIEQEKAISRGARESALQWRISAALRRAGVRGADPDTVVRYLHSRENQEWEPIQAGGEPASEMIVQERASRPWFH